jgi:Transposase DDE domain
LFLSEPRGGSEALGAVDVYGVAGNPAAYAATGPTSVRAAPSSRLAPAARSGASAAGSVLKAVQRRLDEHPEKMRQRRETVEHPFGTIKARMGATHFLMKTLPRVAAKMALHVMAYNLTRAMNIMGLRTLLGALRG